MTRGASVLSLLGLLFALSGPVCARAASLPATAVAPAAANQVLVLLRLPPPHLRGAVGYGEGYDDAAGHAARRRIAGRLARLHGLTLAQDWAMPLIGVDCYVMTVPGDGTAAAAAQALSREPGVEWAEPMSLYRAQSAAAPNDPLFAAEPAARRWRLADLHQMSTGRGVSVAVIDSMIDAAHPDLTGQIQNRQNFVQGRSDAPEAHGTGVAGVIAALENNGMGGAGIAPHARLMALRACWQQASARGPGAPETVCDTLGLAEALHFAVLHKAKIINLSLSGPPDPLLGKLIDVALEQGVTVVGAADRTLPGGGFPASHAGVVAVAEDGMAGATPGLYTAPGRDVPTTQPGGQWTLVNGSSFSAAHVSGLFALLRELDARARTGAALVALPPGGGAIDACATLLKAAGPCDCVCAHERTMSSAGAR